LAAQGLAGNMVKCTPRVPFIYFFGICPLIHPNYFSVMIFISVTELTLALTLTLILTLTLMRTLTLAP